MQDLNASVAISVTDDGMVNCGPKELQPIKELFSIKVTEDGMMIETRDKQSLNALFEILES